MEYLPIDDLIPEITAALRTAPALIITAPPGTGKTTRIPRALYDAGFTKNGEILVLEPRRLAARLAAVRVSSELGEKTGGTVGYTVRFDKAGCDRTRIRFETEGVLSRRIVRDPNLGGISAVILDEFHERHLATDLALSYLRQVGRHRRGDLKLVVMSATLDTSRLESFLGFPPIIKGEDSRFEVRIEYEQKTSSLKLEEKVVKAAVQLLRDGLDGDVLVFLPGAAEIRKASDALHSLASREGLLVVPLHGDMPGEEQDRAVEPDARRKIILATNVAESSITVPGIAAVIDSGLARIASHSAWSGLPMLKTGKISRASAAQRAGRAGRTRSGRVIRLYSRADLESRPEHDLPEIKRADLAETLLTLHGAGIAEVRRFPWFEEPPAPALDAAEELLSALGALDDQGGISPVGRQMLRFPVHPRLARLIGEGERLGVAKDAALLAALLGERDIRTDSRASLGSVRRTRIVRQSASSDLLELRDLYREAEKMGLDPVRLRSMALDPGAVETVRRAQAQLAQLLRSTKPVPDTADDADEALRIATLTAFPDRVARRRTAASRDLVLSGGGGARLSDESAVHGADLMVAVDATERREDKGIRIGRDIWVRLASAIEPEWLAAKYPDEIKELLEIVWNGTAGRVDERRRTTYGEVILEESVRPAKSSPTSSRLLAEAAFARNLADFPDGDQLPALRGRLELLARTYPGEEFLLLDDACVRAAVEKICAGKKSLEELRGHSLREELLNLLSGSQRERLKRETPERMTLKPGRTVKIHYENDKPPWIESHLQDFFGTKGTPSICRGRVPLTIHLLAPNHRAVQVTQDLSGFWKRHYPSIRRELQRRYPKHAWPDPEDL